MSGYRLCKVEIIPGEVADMKIIRGCGLRQGIVKIFTVSYLGPPWQTGP